MASTEQPARPRVSGAASAKVARAYLRALADHDLDGAIALWAPGGRETVHGLVDTTAPDGVRAWLAGLLAAFPDLRLEELSCTAQGERCAIRSRMTGTFAGLKPWRGLAPNGRRLDVEVVDCFVVRDGLLAAGDAHLDGTAVARQLGLLPADGSAAERRMAGAENLRALAASRAAGPLEKVAEGVWLIRGGRPSRVMNVYLIEDGDGITVFDGGVRAMTAAVAKAGARMGPIRRVVLGHAHPDHRGIAAGLGVPVHCHPADRADAEHDGGRRYLHLARLGPLARAAYPRLLAAWDGGPVGIAGTVEEGDAVAGFRVVHLPGHAPGLIALWREADGVALVSDAFYLVDPQTGRRGAPRVPHPAFNHDTEQARASLRKLAALDPAIACPGHAGPLTGDVRAQLERAAAGA